VAQGYSVVAGASVVFEAIKRPGTRIADESSVLSTFLPIIIVVRSTKGIYLCLYVTAKEIKV